MTSAAVPQHVPAHPGASGAAVSARMSAARRRDTAPELALRRALHARGLRYRVTYPVPGNRRRTIDIAFTRAKIAVFVDGCFWHGCPEHGTQPRANASWWATKFAANAARDRDTARLLTEAGWAVIRVWEHEDPDEAATRIEARVHGQGFTADAPTQEAPSSLPRGSAHDNRATFHDVDGPLALRQEY